MKITLKDIMKLKPCYSEEQLVELAAGRESITPTEIAALDIPAEDRLWVLTRLLTSEQACVYARRVAASVLHLWDAPDVVRRWLETGDPELKGAARAAARAPAARAVVTAAATWAAAEAAWAPTVAEAAAEAAAGAAGAATRATPAEATAGAAARATWVAARTAAKTAAKTEALGRYAQWAAEELER